jgi:predicted lipoprotein with Yx(FWY)xxD motif
MVGNRRTRMSRTGVAAALIGVAVLVAACGSSGSSSSSAPAASAAQSSTGSSAPATGVSIGTAKGSIGTYLTGRSGRALYLWAADSSGKSSCSGACASTWPPLITKASPTASGGAMSADLGMITRSDGSKQVTYKGHPLYYYAADTGPGMTKGQGSNQFGAKWWLIAPSGAGITTTSSSKAASSSGSSSSSSSGSSGGWG